MSSLYRSAISARIAKLPHLPQTDEDDVEQSELADGIGALSTGMGPPTMYVVVFHPSTTSRRPFVLIIK